MLDASRKLSRFPTRRVNVSALAPLRAVGILVLAIAIVQCAPSRPASAPRASTRIHGTDVPDPFRSLEDNRSPEVLDFERRHDRDAREVLSRLPLRDVIRRELHDLSYDHRPTRHDNPSHRYVFSRRDPDVDRAIVYVREIDGSDRVLLDPNRWGAETLRRFNVSPDGSLVAYAVGHRGSERTKIRFVRVDDGAVLADELPDVEDSLPTWHPNSQSVCYVHTDFTGDPATRFGTETLRAHRLGESVGVDPVVFGATSDPRTSISFQRTGDGHWGIVSVQYGAGRSELYLDDLTSPERHWTRVPSHRTEANVTVQPRMSSFLLVTDDDAPNGRVVELTPKTTSEWDLHEVVPEDPRHALRRVSEGATLMVLQYWDNGAQRVVVTDERGGNAKVVPLPTPDDVWSRPGANGSVELGVSSPSRPCEFRRYEPSTGATTVVGREDRGVDLSRFETELRYATSKDGTRVPMFVTRPRDQSGPLPTYLYGYGGFRVSMSAPFEPYAVPWLEHGGISVVVMTRGGMEFGEEWHRAGMLRNKQNVFDDFIAATESLVAANLADRERVVMKGWSNGGLLAGALVTQRPDLYRAAIVGVPLADMIRFGDFGQGGVTELGDVANEADFRALLACSPYHHVAPHTQYPSLLITMAENDENAHPMHARKLAAALFASDTKNPVLLRVRWDAAHAGSGSEREQEDEQAEELAFLMDAVGMR